MARRRRSRKSNEEASGLGLAVLVGLAWLYTQGSHLNWQWLVAVAILLGSVLVVAIPVVVRRRRAQQRRRLFQTSATELHYTQFEQRVQHVLHELGWQRVQHVGGSGDGGVDLRGLRDGQRWIVQCKRYKDLVAPQHVRDLYGTLQDEMTRGGAVGALLVTTGRFSQDTRNWVNGKPLELWDGYDLARIEADNEAQRSASQHPQSRHQYHQVLRGVLAFDLLVLIWAVISTGGVLFKPQPPVSLRTIAAAVQLAATPTLGGTRSLPSIPQVPIFTPTLILTPATCGMATVRGVTALAMRAAPGLSTTVVGELAQGAVVSLSCETPVVVDGVSWSKVHSGSREGWMSTTFLRQ